MKKPDWIFPVKTFDDLEKTYPNPVAGQFCWVENECTDERLGLGHCRDDGIWEKDEIFLQDIDSDLIELMYGYTDAYHCTMRIVSE